MIFRRVSLPVAAMLFVAALTSCTGSKDGADEIVLINRQNSSGTYKYFQSRVLAKNDYKAHTKDQSGSQAVVDLVGTTPNAIGYSGMGYKTDKVKFLKISEKRGEAGFLPTTENAKTGTYPITRPLQIYTKGEPQGALRHYIDWILSAEGQKIVADKGFVPIDAQDLGGEPPTGEVSFQVSGSDTMVQLAQAWAAAYYKKYPNVKVQVSGPGSGVGIAGIIDGTVDIANASRKMKADEVAKAKKNGVEPKEYVVTKDALAVYVHKDNPLDTISIEDLSQIYGEGGTISTWQQVDGYPKEKPAE